MHRWLVFPSLTLSFWCMGASFCMATEARAERGAPSIAGSVIVLKRAGVTSYEEVVEEFADHCRVRAHVINLDPRTNESLRAALRPDDVVLAVGQRAVDAMTGSRARVIAALAFDVPPGMVSADALPPPELTLRALKRARPSVRRVGVVFGPRSEALVRRVAIDAMGLGIQLIPARATDGPGAVRELRRIARSVDALWLAPDLDVLTPQLFQYALILEIQEAIPIAGVTRQQVQSGALLAYDGDPHAVGRQAAELVHRILDGATPAQLGAAGRAFNIELTVNGDVARRLGADLPALRALGARIE